MTAIRNVLAAVAVAASLAGAAQANLLVNGDFTDGLNGWTVWTQRNDGGNFSVVADGGLLTESGDSYNGGVYQVVAVPPNVPLIIDGGWYSEPTVANEQWAEVIVVEGNNPPLDGTDVTGPLIFKNDTFNGDVDGWLGAFADTSPVTNDPTAGPLGSGSPSGFVTVILKSGSVNLGTLNGANFGGVTLNAVVPEPSTWALAMAGALTLAAWRCRRRRAAQA